MKSIISRRKNYSYTSFLLLLFCVSCVFSCFVLEWDFQINQHNGKKEDALDKIPKLSNSAINITTPENKSYSEPMSGYYPASYGFENDDNGDDPQDWVLNEAGGTINVKSSEGSHIKVIELYDTSDVQHVLGETDFTSRSFGTIEFWFRTDNVFDETGVAVSNTATSPYNFIWMFVGHLGNSIWEYHNGNTLIPIPNVGAPQNNYWHHIKIHFRCSGGPTYKGLSENRWKVIIDGIDSGELSPRTTKTSVMQFQVATDVLSSNYSTFIDAVGFSWDSNYNIGDNKYEGLSLSYTNTTNIESIGYVLDGHINNSINGNTVIPLPRNGLHNIMVYGKNSSGITVESPLQYFTIAINSPQISINTPHNGENYGVWAPYFNISLTTPILDSTWYTINNGSPIKFTGLYGMIDQAEWNSVEPGYVLIRFWVNDTFGQTSHSEVAVFKEGPHLPPPFDFLIVFIILIAIGLTVINIFVIRKVRRTRSAIEILNLEEKRIAEPQLLKCPLCRNEIKAHHKYCLNCGSKLK